MASRPPGRRRATTFVFFGVAPTRHSAQAGPKICAGAAAQNQFRSPPAGGGGRYDEGCTIRFAPLFHAALKIWMDGVEDARWAEGGV